MRHRFILWRIYCFVGSGCAVVTKKSRLDDKIKSDYFGRIRSGCLGCHYPQRPLYIKVVCFYIKKLAWSIANASFILAASITAVMANPEEPRPEVSISIPLRLRV